MMERAFLKGLFVVNCVAELVESFGSLAIEIL